MVRHCPPWTVDVRRPLTLGHASFHGVQYVCGSTPVRASAVAPVRTQILRAFLRCMVNAVLSWLADQGFEGSPKQFQMCFTRASSAERLPCQGPGRPAERSGMSAADFVGVTSSRSHCETAMTP